MTPEAVKEFMEQGFMFAASCFFFYSWWENRKRYESIINTMIEMHQQEKKRLYNTITAQADEFKAIHKRLDNFDNINFKLDKILEDLAKEDFNCGKQIRRD